MNLSLICLATSLPDLPPTVSLLCPLFLCLQFHWPLSQVGFLFVSLSRGKFPLPRCIPSSLHQKTGPTWSAPNVLLDYLLLAIQGCKTFCKFAVSSLFHKFSLTRMLFCEYTMTRIIAISYLGALFYSNKYFSSERYEIIMHTI